MSKLRSGNVFSKPKTTLDKVVSVTESEPAVQLVKAAKPVQAGSKEALTKTANFFIPGDGFSGFGTTGGRVHRSQVSEGGYSGLQIYSGIVTEEYLPNLTGRRGVQTYEEMRKNDSIVGAMLLAAEQLIHNATVFIKPNKQNPEANEALMAADLVRTSLDDMGELWVDTLSEILTLLPFGWSYCSVWHKKREGYKLNSWKRSRYTDGKYGWAGISLRKQSSLRRWRTNKNGRATGMIQQGPPTWEEVTIPLANAAHFRTKTEGGNPEGISILRNAWRAWHIKKEIELTEALGIGRNLTGIPVITVPEGVDLWNTTDAQQAATLQRLQDMASLSRQDQYHGIVLPFGYEFNVINTAGQRADQSNAVIARWDQRIAVTLLADMLLIGHEKVGSYALVDAKSRLFSAALESIAGRVAGVFTRDLIPRLMRLNGIAEEFWPEMEFGQVDTPNLKDFAEFMKASFDVGLNIDEAYGLYAREVGNIPEPKAGETAVKTVEEKLDEKKQDMELTEEFSERAADKAGERQEKINASMPQPQGNAQPPTKGKPPGGKGKPPDGKAKAPAKKILVVDNSPIQQYSVGRS